MYKITIKNLADYPRQVQYYKINRYVVLTPFNSTFVVSDDFAEVQYYKQLSQKQFEISIEEINHVSEKDLIKTIEATPIKRVDPIIPEITQDDAEDKFNDSFNDILNDKSILPDMFDDTPKVDHTEVKENDERIKTEVKETKSKEVKSIDELTDAELKSVVKNLGIKTSVRARQKLIDLISVNLPDNANLSDYI